MPINFDFEHIGFEFGKSHACVVYLNLSTSICEFPPFFLVKGAALYLRFWFGMDVARNLGLYAFTLSHPSVSHLNLRRI